MSYVAMPAETITYNDLSQLIAQGYEKQIEESHPLKDKIVETIVLSKSVGPIGRVWRLFACICGCPCLSVACCFATDKTERIWDNLGRGGCDGRFEKYVVVVDQEKTNRQKAEDFKKLNLDVNDLPSFIKQRAHEKRQCPGYDLDYFLPFQGPITGFTYLIFIPQGNDREATLSIEYHEKIGIPIPLDKIDVTAQKLAAKWHNQERADERTGLLS